MKLMILIAAAVTLVGTALAVQSATRSPTSTRAATPSAVPTLIAPTSVPTASGTATAAPAGPKSLGSYDDPHDFRGFAARLDKAIQTVEVQFFLDNVVFQELKCGVDFPASTKACEGKPRGAAVQGIAAGVWASEGLGLDADGYESFIRGFLTKSDASAFDAYGDPCPRLYAYGIFKPDRRGSDVSKHTVQAIATSVMSQPGSKLVSPGRIVLILDVRFDGGLWRIAKLAVTPPLQRYPLAMALLDPSRLEAEEMFEYWTQVAQTAAASTTLPTAANARQPHAFDKRG